jgi:hypothetical protein
MTVLWSGKLQGDEDEVRVRLVIEDDELYTERREACACGNPIWRRDLLPNVGVLKKALLAMAPKKRGKR